MANTIDRGQLLQIQAAVEMGFRRGMESAGRLKPFMSQKEAHDKYGRATVERWASEGLIDIIKDGTGRSKCRISRQQIETVAFTANRSSWFEHHE